MKKLLSIILCLTLVVAIYVPVSAESDKVTVTLDGKEVVFPDAQPFVDERDRTLVPIRFVSEAMGAQVDWDGESYTAIIKKDNDVIKYTIGDAKAFINDEMITFDTYGIVKDERTFVPLRYISELLYCDVEWEKPALRVKITSPGEIKKFPDPQITMNFPESEFDKRLFWITLENASDFARECPNYEYKIEFISPAEFNEFEQDEGALVGWSKYDRNEFKKLTASNNTILSVSRAFYSTRDNMKKFEPTEGMDITFKLTVLRKCSGEQREYTVKQKLELPYPLIEWED